MQIKSLNSLAGLVETGLKSVRLILPFKLELHLFHAALPLVLNIENRIGGHVDSFSGYLNAEGFFRFPGSRPSA